MSRVALVQEIIAISCLRHTGFGGKLAGNAFHPSSNYTGKLTVLLVKGVENDRHCAGSRFMGIGTDPYSSCYILLNKISVT